MPITALLLILLAGICGYVIGVLHGILFMPEETVKRIKDMIR